MNNLKTISALCLLAVSSAASADFIGFYAGGQRWDHDIEGYISSLGNNIDVNQDLGLSDSDANVYFVAIEHPIPLLPNVKIQRNNLDGGSTGIASQDFTFQSGNFPTGSTTRTNYDLSHTDYTLYYEVLDNWVNLDLGISAKKFDGFVDIRPAGPVTLPVVTRVDISGTVPMFYGKAQFDLPFTGFSAGASAQLGQFGDDDLTDASLYLAYEGDSGFGLELGYRTFDLEFDDFDQLSSELTLDGFYLGLNFHL